MSKPQPLRDFVTLGLSPEEAADLARLVAAGPDGLAAAGLGAAPGAAGGHFYALALLGLAETVPNTFDPAAPTLYRATDKGLAQAAILEPPSNTEAEQALLGIVIYDNSAYERAGDGLKAEHFHEPFHRRLWGAIEELLRKGMMAEPIVLMERFKADPAFIDLGGLSYLADLVDRAPPATNAPEYGRVILDLAQRREVIAIAEDAAMAARRDPEATAREIIEEAEGRLFKLAETGQAQGGFVSFGAAVTGAVEMAAAAYGRDGGVSGVSTGLIDLDQLLGGLHPSDLVILAGRPSMGKAQPLDAKVLMKDGRWVQMGDLRGGESLASIDGAPSVVAGVYPQGLKQIYRVIFSDGRAAEACAEHLWRIYYRDWPAPRILSTEQVSALLDRRRYRGRIWIDAPSGHFGDRAELPVDPWVLGALIGDGNLAGSTPVFSTADKAALAEMRSRLGPAFAVEHAANYDYRIKNAGGARRKGVFGVIPNPLGDALKSLGLQGKRADEKFIPECYFSASRETRADLLRGLMDTDGWVETFGAVRFCSASEALASGVARLVHSLGGQASVNGKSTTYSYKGRRLNGLPAYVVNIQNLAADDLFTLDRKRARVGSGRRSKRLTVARIEPCRISSAQCIAVTHPSRLYLTDGYIATHNTSLACNIAFHAARRYAYDAQPDGSRKTTAGGVVGLFSLEMSAEQLALRIIAEAAAVPSDKLRKGKTEASEFGRVRDAAIELNDAPLFIDATGGITMPKLAARARRLKRTTGLDLVVVDYLQLVQGSNEVKKQGKVQEVSEITMALKALAKELNVPVLALSQLSRQVESREDKRPQLSDLRESGSIEQDADVVMFVYREEYYLARTEPREATEQHLAWQEQMDACRNIAEVIIGKARHGPIGTVKLHFNADLTKFSNLDRRPGGGGGGQ